MGGHSSSSVRRRAIPLSTTKAKDPTYVRIEDSETSGYWARMSATMDITGARPPASSMR